SSRPPSTQYYALDSTCSAYGSSCAYTRCSPVSSGRTPSQIGTGTSISQPVRPDARAHHFQVSASYLPWPLWSEPLKRPMSASDQRWVLARRDASGLALFDACPSGPATLGDQVPQPRDGRVGSIGEGV